MKVDKEEILNYDEKKFLNSLNEKYQEWKSNPVYRKRVDMKDAPEEIRSMEDIYDIPLVDMAEFKDHPEELAIGETEFNLYSSGTTSGRRSKGPRTEEDFKKHRKFFNNLSQEMLPDELDYMALIAPSGKLLDNVPDPKISNRSVFNYARWGFEDPYDSDSFVDFSGGEPEIEFDKLYKNLDEKEGDLGLFGTQKYILGFFKYLENNSLELDLGERGAVATGGGSAKEVDGEEFRSMCNKYLGIEEENQVDFYGMTESMLMTANKAGDENPDKKRVPSQGMVYVIDKDKLMNERKIEPVENGEPGIAVFLDALNGSHPGAILTDDIVKKTGGEYGEEVRIEHLGRSSM